MTSSSFPDPKMTSPPMVNPSMRSSSIVHPKMTAPFDPDPKTNLDGQEVTPLRSDGWKFILHAVDITPLKLDNRDPTPSITSSSAEFVRRALSSSRDFRRRRRRRCSEPTRPGDRGDPTHFVETDRRDPRNFVVTDRRHWLNSSDCREDHCGFDQTDSFGLTRFREMGHLDLDRLLKSNHLESICDGGDCQNSWNCNPNSLAVTNGRDLLSFDTIDRRDPKFFVARDRRDDFSKPNCDLYPEANCDPHRGQKNDLHRSKRDSFPDSDRESSPQRIERDAYRVREEKLTRTSPPIDSTRNSRRRKNSSKKPGCNWRRKERIDLSSSLFSLIARRLRQRFSSLLLLLLLLTSVLQTKCAASPTRSSNPRPSQARQGRSRSSQAGEGSPRPSDDRPGLGGSGLSTFGELLPLKSSFEVRRCNTTCDLSKRNIKVCGTDGRTYDSECDLRRAQCLGANVQMANEGTCKESRCLVERKNAQLQQRRDRSVGVIVPTCKADGSFVEVQCHGSAALTKYCWCVSRDGKPIPGSSVRDKTPNCKSARRGDSGDRGERSPPFRKKTKTHTGKGCNQADRFEFNKNLIGQFKQEFERVPRQSREGPNLKPDPTLERRIIEWKFADIDADGDGRLKRRELKQLQRMVRKYMTPKACARHFVVHCDLDQDARITRSEWSVCLGVPIQDISFKLFLSLNSGEREAANGATDGKRGNKKEEGKASLLGGFPHSQGFQEDDDMSKESPSCTQERENAESDAAKDPDAGIFVPECAPTGNYRQDQCHRSTGYCWCVNIYDGRPITGTATHNMRPNCDMNPERKLKGCPGLKKQRFVTHLLRIVKKEMEAFSKNETNTNHRSLAAKNPKLSIDEQAAVWKYSMLDEDSNGLIERRERRNLKRELRKIKKLKRCRKYFVEFCDQNDDNAVSLREWLTCTALAQNRGMNLALQAKRRGPNPFSRFLNSDRY